MADAPVARMSGDLAGQQSAPPIITQRETDYGPPARKRLAATTTPGQDYPLIVELPEGLLEPLTGDEELMLLAVGGLESMDVFQESALHDVATTLRRRYLELSEGATPSAAAEMATAEDHGHPLPGGTTGSSAAPSRKEGKQKQGKQTGSAPKAPQALPPRPMTQDDRALLIKALSKTVSDPKSGFVGHDDAVKYVASILAPPPGEELEEVVRLLFEHYLRPLEVTYATYRGTGLSLSDRVVKTRAKGFHRDTTDMKNNLPTHMETSAVYKRVGELDADHMIKRLVFLTIADYIYEEWRSARVGALYRPSPPARWKEMPAQVS